jgi:hypothetical protein
MPAPRRPSDHQGPARRRGREPGEDPQRVRTSAARGNQAITIGAIGLAVVGGVALWLMWSRPAVVVVPPAPAPAAAAEAAPAAAPVPATTLPPPSAAVVRTFARGIALGGEGLTIDGHRWLGLAQAQANGLELAAGTAPAPAASIAAARLDFETKTMLDGGLAASGPVKFSQALPDGDYEVTLWAAGAQGIDASQIGVRLCGTDVELGKVAGAATWSRLGPYAVRVRDRQLSVAVAGLGAAHLSGLAITALGSGQATVPPVVGLTSPGGGAVLFSSDIPLVADVLAGSGRLAKVEFFDGAAKLGEALAPPWTWTWSHPAVGRHELSVVASDSTAVRAGSGAVAVTIKADDGSAELLIERAKDAMRALGLESTRLVADRDGLHLNLAGTAITDLGWVMGLPLTDLDIHDCRRLTELGALAGLPLRRLIMHNVKPRDFAFLRGMPLTDLRVWGCGIVDLAPLAGMKLETLEAGGNPLVDIHPLAGMPLRNLYLQHDAIADFSPLAGMALQELDAGGTRLSDLTLIARMPLNVLRIWSCPVTTLAPLAGTHLKLLHMGSIAVDLAPLAGLPLEELSLNEAPVSDLSVLAGMPLRRLDLWGTAVTSLARLRGLPLTLLRLGRTAVTDLAPIAGMAIEELDLRECEHLGSLAPVATLPRLRLLGLPNQRPDLDSLRNLPGVQIRLNGRDETRDVSEFFKAWDAANGRK